MPQRERACRAVARERPDSRGCASRTCKAEDTLDSGGHVQGQLRAHSALGAPERSAPGGFVGAAHCGSPRVMGKRAAHTFRR